MNHTTIETVLAFDFGLRRIGVAVGQTITRTAKPLPTLLAKNGEPDWREITRLIAEWRPEALVVGIPLNMDGTKQAITFEAEAFAKRLAEDYHLPVHGMDERLSTRDARERLFEAGGYKKLKNTPIDGIAAQLILESWFAEHGN
jgi:putative Holliday junction resolvase